MIFLEATNDKPYVSTGNSKKEISSVLPSLDPQEINDICICDYISCKYVENVFAEIGGQPYKNDFSEFLFKRFINSDSVKLSLLKDSVKVADLDGNTLGELFDGFSSGNEDQKKYYGFLISWEKVLQNHGSGNYRIKAELNLVGVESIYESRDFYLLPYSVLNADGTVKIETVQNGNILGSSFDFTGLEWKQYLRIRGSFGNPTPFIENDRYLTSQKELRQIKSKVSREWTLSTKLVNWEVSEKLIYNKLMANQILITDYNIKAENVWRSINVKTESIDKPEIFGNPYKYYIIKFVDNRSIFEKTNF